MGVFFVTCGPNQALVVSGCGNPKPKLVAGGRVFIWPGLQQLQKISLNTMTLKVESPNVITYLGVPISVTGIAQVRIQGQDKEMLMAACELFLGKTEDEIRHVVLETLEGHQRAIMGTMTVEEIYQDRKKFNKKVYEVASSDLVNMGVTVVSYTIKDVSDGNGYLAALGATRTAEVKRDAKMGEASAKSDQSIKTAIANEQKTAADLENKSAIAKAKRDFDLNKAAYDQEINTKEAEAKLAFELQAAIVKQKIREEELQIQVAERSKMILIQEEEIKLKERNLEATVRKPAEAMKYKLETLADAERKKIILEAEAQAENLKLKGEAEAFAIQAKADAEAKNMTMKAAAFKEYSDAARVTMIMDALPKVASEVAKPISQTKKITMVSADGETGAAKLTGEVVDIMLKVPNMVKAVTGVDLKKNFS